MIDRPLVQAALLTLALAALSPALAEGEQVEVGDEAPLFSLSTDSGETLKLESLRGEESSTGNLGVCLALWNTNVLTTFPLRIRRISSCT